MPKKRGSRMRRFHQEAAPAGSRDVQQQEEGSPQQQDQEDPPELPCIKEEQEELWTNQEEAGVTRFQDLKNQLKEQLLTASREDLIGHFETTISRYEKKIDRQQKLLDVILKPEIKLRRTECPADVQQLVVSKKEDGPEHPERRSSLDQKDPPELPRIKEEQEELWTNQEEADVNKLSRIQDVKGFFRWQLLSAAREDLIGHLETTMSRYEKELDRQQKLLDVVLKPQMKLRRAGAQQLLVSKEEVPPEQQEWSSSLNQEYPLELPRIKQEQEEHWISQEGEQHHDITKFTFTPVPVKNEEEDEGKPQSSPHHQRQETGDNVEDSSETDVSDGDWEETRERQSDLNRPKNNDVSVSGVGNNTGKKPVISSDCDERSRQSSKLKTHPRTHTGEKPFHCQECDKRFSQKHHLVRHMRFHTGEKPYTCRECGKRFSEQQNLMRHMAIHTGEKPFSCSECGERFVRKYHLTRHMARHTGEKPFNCSECGEAFSQQQSLNRHMRTHTGEKPFSCSICDKRFIRKAQLTHHMAHHTGEKPFSCPECGERFIRKDHLTQHMAHHSGEKPFSCSECGEKFIRKAHLTRHMAGHAEEKPFGCSECGKRFTQKGNWTQHMTLHTGEKMFSCSVCDRKFTWRSQLGNHVCAGRQSSKLHQKQTEQMALKVDGEDCGGLEPAKSSDGCVEPVSKDNSDDSDGHDTREAHLSSDLTNSNINDSPEKPLCCSECGKTFHKNSHLNRHMRTHTGEKPFSCSNCGKGFGQKEHLQKHLKCHTGEKPHSCPVCDKCFSQSEHLQLHMRTHTKEKRYTCTVCDKSFIWLNQLKRHHCSGQSSQLNQRENKQMETEADGKDCGGPKPDRNSDPDRHLQAEAGDKVSDFSESESEKGEKDWTNHDGNPCRCPICGKSFQHRGNLNKHVRTHTGEKPFICSVCNKCFSQKSGLDYHLKIHTGERPFCCSICGNTYRNKGALNYHLAIHTGVKPYSCSDCGKKFRGASQLRLHKCDEESSQIRRNYRRTKTLSCSACNKTFPNNYVFMTHMRAHKGKKLFICKICGTQRQYSSHLEIHMRTHTGEKPYSCSVCGKRFTQRGIMTQHMAIHSGVEPFSCRDCGRKFFWQYQVKKHKCLTRLTQQRQHSLDGKYNSGSEPVRYLDLCKRLWPKGEKDTKLSSENDDSVDLDFWRETRQHQSGFTYSRKHLSEKVSANDGETPLSCSDATAKNEPKTDVSRDFCEQSNKNERVSVGNSGSNTDKKPPSSSYNCLFCGKGFDRGGYLTRHVSIHLGEKQLSCIVCEQTFTTELALISHECGEKSSQIVEPISGNKLFLCPQCGRGFSRKHNMQVHMRRIHMKEKRFDCSVCGKAFSRPESLSFHMTCHTGEKPFHCSVCNTGFIDSESLVRHMRVHTRQTQFSCTVCGKEFAWRRYLTKHMESHTKEKMYRCEVCDQRFDQISQLSCHQCDGESSKICGREAGETEQMETEAGGEDCGGPEPDRNSDLHAHLQPETEDPSVTDDWREPGEPQTASKGWKLDDVSRRGLSGATDECGDALYEKMNKRNHTREKLFDSSNCANHTTERADLSQPMADQNEPPHIKEEPEEQSISQEEEQLHDSFTSVPVKSEDDDEEKPQSSLLHQTEVDGEDCGGPERVRSSPPDGHLQPETDDASDTGDSVDSDFWKETRERPTTSTSVKNTSESVVGCDSDLKASESVEAQSDDSVDSDFWKDDRTQPESCRKLHSCSECGRRFLYIHHLKNHMRFHVREKAPFFCSVCGTECPYKSHLKIHMRTHTGEKPFSCPVCGKKYAHKASMQSHMAVHSANKQYTCSVCDRSFGWYTELKYHQCVGSSSQQTSSCREAE